MSLNSSGRRVGHQQIAKFLLSMLLSLLFSLILNAVGTRAVCISKNSKKSERRREQVLHILNKVFEYEFENMKIGCRKSLNQIPEGQQALTAVQNARDVCQLIHLLCGNERRQSLGEEVFESSCNSIHRDVQFPDGDGRICGKRGKKDS